METTSHAQTASSTRPMVQKKIGILGGASNVATVEYYKMLNAGANSQLGGWDIAETLIAGMNFGNIEALVRAGDWAQLTTYMSGHVNSLIAGGADLLVCVSNTLHECFTDIMATHATPWIHIADPTGAAIRERDIGRVALFGTRPVMELEHLRQRYDQQFGIEVVAPNESEKEEIDRIIFEELVKDVVDSSSKDRYLAILDDMIERDEVEGLIMGCTEIFLLLEPADRPNLPMFNTTRLHCQAVLDEIYHTN